MRRSRAGQISAGVACALMLAAPAIPASAAATPNGPAKAHHVPARSAARMHAAAASAKAHWQVDKRLPLDLAESPSEVTTGYSFLDVEPVGPHDAWAVGTSGVNDLFWAHPVLRHWHDGRWLTPRIPAWMNGAKPGGWLNELSAVGGSSPDNVWAMGTFLLVTESVDRAVHWNGKTWTKATVPSPGAFAPYITSIVATSASNAWAFGCYCEASDSPYIAHYYRGRWHDVTPASVASAGGIDTASVISPSDIWAVAAQPNIDISNVLHWNGKHWSVYPMPASLATGANRFFAGGGIVATKNNGVWLAGAVGPSYQPAVTRLYHGRWTIKKVAAPDYLAELVSDGHGGMWSASWPVGSTSAQIWHYTGGRWSHSADPAGIDPPYRVTWMAAMPGSRTVLGIGQDAKNEVLLSYAS
jgi:hypothetical protein